MTTAPVLSTRERIVARAVEITTEAGWADVTMARLADDVGVSRQTVYNELGSKAGLAEAMVMRELERFLADVEQSFDEHGDDLVAAIATSARRVLVSAQDNELLRAVVSATHGADTDLLPLLTTHAHSLLEVAKTVILDRLAGHQVPLDPRRLDAAIDMVVRVVLSHVMQPSGSPEQTAADLAWLAERVLR